MENSNSDSNPPLPSRPQDTPHDRADPPSQAAPSSASDQQTSPSSPPASTSAQGADDAAPTTTLWENFMASFRTVIHSNASESSQPNQQPTAQSANDASPSSTSSANQPAASAATPSSSAAQPAPNPDTFPSPPVFFRLPFAGPDGNPALLAFHPQPLPHRDGIIPDRTQPHSPANATPTPSQPRQPDATRPTVHPTAQPGSNTGTSPSAPHSHPHPDGHVPIAPLFVPFGASPLPFSFIYDAHTQTAWPIAQVTPGSPPGGPSPDAPESQQPRLVAGPPFRIILDIHFSAAPEPEQPDPQKAADYVKGLERADAELRARMARLGIGSIGGFGQDNSSAAEQDALLGCGICLDNYSAEDRPEWIDGPKSQDEAVVAVPCLGHHTLHAGCLRDWLEKLPPSQWTCPFCRASISPNPINQQASSQSPSKSAATSSSPTLQTTLRDEVRARERKRGWRCDAPACLPRYPVSSQADDGHLELPETSDDMTTDLVKLAPCHHEVHLDCLCTSMRIENDLTGADDLDAILNATDSDSLSSDYNDHDVAPQSAQPQEADADQQQHDTVGKWVNCPACRKECWAELPLRRRPNRAAHEASKAVNPNLAGDSQVLTKTSQSEVQSDTEQTKQTAPHHDIPDVGSAAENPVASDEETFVDAMLAPN